MLQVIVPHPRYNVCDTQMSSWGESSRPCNAHALSWSVLLGRRTVHALVC
jgi:hypothetical protein